MALFNLLLAFIFLWVYKGLKSIGSHQDIWLQNSLSHKGVVGWVRGCAGVWVCVLSLTIPLTTLANPSWWLLSFHHLVCNPVLNSSSEWEVSLDVIGRISGVLRGPWGQPALQNCCLPESGPALPAPGLLQRLGHHHTSTLTWSSLLQLLTSLTTPFDCPLPAPQKVKTVTRTQSYYARPPPKRSLISQIKDISLQNCRETSSVLVFVQLFYFSQLWSDPCLL